MTNIGKGYIKEAFTIGERCALYEKTLYSDFKQFLQKNYSLKDLSFSKKLDYWFWNDMELVYRYSYCNYIENPDVSCELEKRLISHIEKSQEIRELFICLFKFLGIEVEDETKLQEVKFNGINNEKILIILEQWTEEYCVLGIDN